MLFVLTLATFLAACGGAPGVFLPDGDPAAGKVVFENFKCFSCHEVVGDSFPDPTTITPTFVTLGGSEQAKLTRGYLVESIIAPSHEFAPPRPPTGQEGSDRNIKSGNRSRMTDYGGQMTVRQLFDLVAYLEQLQGGAAGS
jgi:hypothetical protein